MGILDINAGYTVATLAKQHLHTGQTTLHTLAEQHLHYTRADIYIAHTEQHLHTGRSQHISHTMAEQHCTLHTHGPNSIDIALIASLYIRAAINITPHTGQTTLHLFGRTHYTRAEQHIHSTQAEKHIKESIHVFSFCKAE